jgi:hypothetical protein
MLYINDTYLYEDTTGGGDKKSKEGDIEPKPKDANLVYIYVLLGCLVYPIVYDGT